MPAAPAHTDGDACPSCSEVLGSPSVCAISHDFRPGAYDGRGYALIPAEVRAEATRGRVIEGYTDDGVAVPCLAPSSPAVQAAIRGLERVAPVEEPHCPRCGRTKSVARWTNEQTGEPFYVCSSASPGNGCGHSFAEVKP
jgi:hypothetical protein